MDKELIAAINNLTESIDSLNQSIKDLDSTQSEFKKKFDPLNSSIKDLILTIGHKL